MTMQGGTARDRLRARAQAMYGGKRREDEEQQNRQNQRQEAETPAVGSARDRLRQRASAMGEVTGQRENAQEPTQERSRLTVEGYEAAIKGMQERMGGQTGLTKSGIVRHTQSRETEKWRQEQAKKYSGLRDQADYAKKSTKVDQSLASGKGAYIFGHYVGKGDDVYSYINSIGTAYENRSNAGKTPSGKLAKYAYMTDDEVADYNYLYQTKGKEEAEKYLEYMGTELDARRAAGFSQWNSELAEKAPHLASAVSVPMNLASGVGLVGVGLQNIRNQVTGEYKPINYYSPAMDATVASTAIRGTRAQQLTDKYGTIQMDEKEHPLLSRIFNGKSWGDVYQLGMSMVDSAAAAGIGKGTGLTAAGTALLGGSAGSQGVLDAVERGATDSQALTMGILNATFESLFEYVSLDHLLKGNTKNILKGFLKQGFIEGSEEWNTTLFNTIADVLVMAENSDYKTSVRDYMEQGYSEKEAERQAMFDIAVGMGWDFVGGAISGGLMDTGKQIVRDATYKSKFGKASGDIVAEAQEVAPGTALTQKAQERIDAGKSLTGHQIVNLLQQNEDAIRTGDMVTIRNAVAERLAQYGESQNIDRVADAITKQVAGEKLSGKEKALVENSAYGQRVLNEMNPENISEGGFNSDWAGQLGTTQINAEAYSQKLREAQAETQQEEPQQTERQEMTPEEMAVLSAWNSEAESSPANSTTVQPNLGDRETLEKLGVKTGSQLRAEVRQALTERQDVAQKVQQRTQVAQQTQETQGTTQQTQGEPVTLEEASKAYGKQAKAFLRTYQQGQDVEKFSEAYRIAHEMGQSNVPYRVVQGLRSLDYLTEAQKDIAYRTGASAEKQERGGKKATWRRQGVVRAENGAKLSDLSKTFNVPQKQGYRILSDIAKSTGVDIVLYRSKGDAEGNITEAEGRFRRSENTIFIDVNSGIDNVNSTADFSQYTMLRTFNHEFTHFIEQNADEEYRELRKLVFEVMQEKLDGQEGGVTVDDLIREKQDKYRQALGQEVSYDEASREVVADAMTDILPDSHFMETLYSRNATLAEKLIGKLKDFIAKVKAYFDGLTTNTKAEAALLKEMRDGGLHYLESIVEAYDKAATAAVENYQGAETRSEGGEDQYMARGKYWRPQLKQEEWDLLEWRMNAEIKSGENFLDEATKWVYADEKGVQVFALYGIGDGTDATPLYAVGGKKAAAYNAAMTEFMERSQKYDGDGRSVDPLSELPWRKEGSRSGNLSQTSRKTGDAEGVSELHGGSQRSDSGRASGRGTENQRGVKDQFSLREPVEETRDLLALHNMTADNLRGALKLGGLPMPSIAIVKAAAGHSKYGPISVVFEKGTIDPQADRRNKVYGGDAYTPTAPKVEYPVNDRVMRKVEKHLAELSGQVAGGIFLNGTALRRLGIEDESSMNADALAERLARDDSVQAAYLADSGKALEPVRQPKEFSKFGNGALQQLVSEVGVQELARINAEMQTGNYAAVREIEGTIRDIIRSTYEVQHRGFLDRKPELKQKRIAHYMENNVNIRTVEDFARDAWNFYQDNGATTDEIDRWATADKLHEMVTQDQVKAWLRPQLEGLLGEAGIYNGKDRYTSSGNQRSFAQTHYAYTLENIVRAMAETQKERGGQTFGVTAKTMQAVSTPSYDSIAAIKADSGRLGAVEGEAYDAAVQKVETQIEQSIRKVMRENKPHSDNQFDEMEIIGEVMMEAAKGTKTEAAIQRAFQKEDYTISKETAKMVQKLFRDAAALPTEYFEAKPQRAVPFNEAAAVVVPDDLPVGLKKGLEELGATVREYKAGDEQSRLEAVNAIPDVQFSIREIKGEDGTDYGKGVYLDSTLLEGLTDAERKEMMRERVKELGGQTITAYDPNGEAVDIRIAAPSEKFRNRNGRRVPVTNDLARKNRDVKVKQESVVLADELIATSQYKRPRKAKYPHGWLDNNGKNDWQYWTTYIQDKNNTVWEATLNVAESANGVKYLYDIDPIEKVGQPVKSGTSTTLVGQPVKSGTSTTGDIVAQDQTESQAQIRSSTLSDRDVLRIAAQMAKNSESRSLTDADRARLGIIEQKLGRIDEAEEQRQGFLEEKRAILAGREAKELSDAERAQLRKVQKNLDTVNGKIRRLNEELSQTQEKKVVKALLKKARVVVERDAVQRSVSSYRETRQRAEYMGKLRRSVERNAKRLQEMLLTNTDKKHVPEALKKPVAELLRSMNLISKRGLAGGAMTKADERYVKALRGIQDVLARQSLYEESGKGDDLIGGYLDLPAGFQMLLNAYVSKVEKAIEEHPLRNGVLQTMTVEELEETNTVLSVISTAVTEMNKLMVNRQFATVVDAAEDTIWALNEHEQHQKKTGENFLVWDNCLPWYAFQRFGEGGKSIFQGLMNGWDKLAFNTKKVLDFRNGLIDDKTARKWDTETHTVMLENSKGGQEEVTLTTAQLMSLYCLSRRKQAMGHLMGGGIRIASIDIAEEIENVRAAEEGKPVREKKKKKKDVDQAEHYLLTQGELGRLLSLLTPEQVQAAKAMQRYMTEQGSAWGNEVSMRRFGYRAFTEENYFPIETDSQDRPAKTDSKEGSLYRLLNISAVKPLTEGANNAIMVRSIFDVFANHMADMAKYNALALPVLDAQKWYNYKDSSKNKDNGQVRTRTVQREMTRAWGSGANNYVVTFLKDINGVKENGARGEGMAAKAISKYKRAAVAANLRVAMLQPTSYVRASAVIDHKYLAKAMTKKVITKAEGQEMLQYSGVALWKEMGFFDTDVGRSIRDRIKGKGSKIEDLVDKSMAAAQAGDKITWERLWLACKLEAEEKRHLTGEELMEATAERFREVIYRTQVVDSTMTRSHMMRDGGTFSKIATSFMSEATVSYNMLMNSTLDTLQDAQSMGMQKAVKKNWRQLGRAYQAYILAGAASAIAGALADALRDWDDDSFLEKFWKAFWGEKPEKVKDQVLNIMLGLEGNLAGELNPLSKIPLIRDVTNTFGGFSTDRMDMAAWANLYSLLGIWEETIGLWTGSLDKATKTTYYGNMTTYNKIYKTAQVVSQFTGLPISATMREIVTMWNSTVGLAYPGTKVRTYESRKVREAYEQYGKSVGLSYVMILRAAEAVRQLESDKDEDGNAISGSLKKKYVEYIQSLHLSAKQEKAMWNCIKKTSWSDKDTPWGK